MTGEVPTVNVALPVMLLSVQVRTLVPVVTPVTTFAGYTFGAGTVATAGVALDQRHCDVSKALSVLSDILIWPRRVAVPPTGIVGGMMVTMTEDAVGKPFAVPI
jgi:hypothetical protein